MVIRPIVYCLLRGAGLDDSMARFARHRERLSRSSRWSLLREYLNAGTGAGIISRPTQNLA
jgi:hypothetical protein